ncbi:hypothetical protein PSCLAVI8L_50131 [Pseudoclavibacter sp. 8L]|nr:hypothetical protein PSCLAVI8L_50131 [Pseudoclavibacter sp. 8L]
MVLRLQPGSECCLQVEFNSRDLQPPGLQLDSEAFPLRRDPISDNNLLGLEDAIRHKLRHICVDRGEQEDDAAAGSLLYIWYFLVLERRVSESKSADVGCIHSLHCEESDESTILHRGHDCCVPAKKLLIPERALTCIRLHSVGAKAFMEVVPVSPPLLGVSEDEDIWISTGSRNSLLLLPAQHLVDLASTKSLTDAYGPGEIHAYRLPTAVHEEKHRGAFNPNQIRPLPCPSSPQHQMPQHPGI